MSRSAAKAGSPGETERRHGATVDVVRIAGASGSGKTTLIELLVPRLRGRGLKVGTIKHAHHGFELDRPGKDSWRHTRAGARLVTLIGPEQTATIEETPSETSPEEAIERIRRLGLVDVVLVEGFRSYPAREITLGAAQGAAPEANGEDRIVVSEGSIALACDPLELTEAEIDTLVDFCAGSRGDADAGSR